MKTTDKSGVPTKNKQAKIQSMIITHLRDHGTLDILLPDGIALEIGITQLNRKGVLVKADDYCYVSAQRDKKSVLLDSYDLGLSFDDSDDTLVFEEEGYSDTGDPIRRIDVI
jgi:hypothetical protein